MSSPRPRPRPGGPNRPSRGRTRRSCCSRDQRLYMSSGIITPRSAYRPMTAPWRPRSIRLEAERGAADRRPEPAEAADHLVVDHEHVVLGAHRHDLREISLRRHEHAARADHRLGDEGRDRVRAFLQDQLFQFGGERVAKSSSLRCPCRSDSGRACRGSTRAIVRSKSMWCSAGR